MQKPDVQYEQELQGLKTLRSIFPNNYLKYFLINLNYLQTSTA